MPAGYFAYVSMLYNYAMIIYVIYALFTDLQMCEEMRYWDHASDEVFILMIIV